MQQCENDGWDISCGLLSNTNVPVNSSFLDLLDIMLIFTWERDFGGIFVQ